MADYFEIDFLGVETKKSGDAISIRYEKEGQTFIHVIDGGYTDTGTKLRNNILQFYDHPRFIDHVVATHNDGDHARGLTEILEYFEVGTLWMLRPWLYAGELLDRFETYTNVDKLRARLRSAYPNLAALEDIALRKGIQIREPFQGAQIGHFRVMAPTRNRFLDLVVTSDKTPEAREAAYDGGLGALILEKFRSAVAYVAAAWGAEAFPAEDTSNENEMSVVQFAQLCGEKILLTGDTGRDGLAEVIAYAPFIGLALPGVDRFQVPHHGGRRNVNTDLLDAIIGPILAVQPAVGHFSAYISSAKEDRTKWGLAADYPMTAPAYSAQRSALAKKLGLGRKPKAVLAPEPVRKGGRKAATIEAPAAVAAPKKRGRPAKAAVVAAEPVKSARSRVRKAKAE